MALDEVKDVEIDGDGVFKYVLIEVKRKGSQSGGGATKTVVRGFEWAEFHSDILDRVSPRFAELGLEYDCMGGGRIRHDRAEKKLHIYGYSVGYGQANHKITQGLLMKHFHYPDGNITWSNAGY